MDALLSTVQMPSGIPVAAVAINGGANAALLSAEILAVSDPEIAAKLKGHLLLVHGDIDNNVHPGNTMRVVEALIRAGKRFDMLMLPQQRHGFGDMNEYFYWRLVDYFSEHLRGESEKSVDIPKR